MEQRLNYYASQPLEDGLQITADSFIRFFQDEEELMRGDVSMSTRFRLRQASDRQALAEAIEQCRGTLTQQEIADKHNISVSTVKTLLKELQQNG